MLNCIFLLIFLLLLLLCNKKNKSNKRSFLSIDVFNKINKKFKVVIDTFTFFQESLMLSARLERMNKYVDYFIIILSNTTFSGMKLNISFSPFDSYIEKFKKRIILYNVSHPPFCKKSWCREKYQRNSISSAIKSLKISNESIIIISDLDEIPTSNAMKYIIKNPPISFYMLSGYLYLYNYRNKDNSSWPGVIVLKASQCDMDIHSYRVNRYLYSKTKSIPIYPALTHCTFCFKNISLIQKKLQSYSHIEFNNPKYTSRYYISNCIKNHIHLFLRYKLEVVEYDKELLPLPNDERFNYLKEEYEFN